MTDFTPGQRWLSESETELGLGITSVRVIAVRPEAEVEKALQTPAREQIQQAADRGTFERRAQAVYAREQHGRDSLCNRDGSATEGNVASATDPACPGCAGSFRIGGEEFFLFRVN